MTVEKRCINDLNGVEKPYGFVWFVRCVGTAAVIAGDSGGAQGNQDGIGQNALFYGPAGIAIGPNDVVYIAEWGNAQLRTMTTSGDVSTLIGGGHDQVDGPLAVARLHAPYGLCVDTAGTVYITEQQTNSIRMVSTSGMVYTIASFKNLFQGFADGFGTNAKFSVPYGIAATTDAKVYVADSHNGAVRLVNLAGEWEDGTGNAVSSFAIKSIMLSVLFRILLGWVVHVERQLFASKLHEESCGILQALGSIFRQLLRLQRRLLLRRRRVELHSMRRSC